jgi:hypothetical protein
MIAPHGKILPLQYAIWMTSNCSLSEARLKAVDLSMAFSIQVFGDYLIFVTFYLKSV